MHKESIEIALRYEGPDVADGTMSVQDIVPVLQGFSSAYGRIASADDPNSTHRLRITGVHPGSAIIALDVWTTLNDNANVIASASAITGGAIWIIKKIIGVVKLKKHVKNQPFSERISATNSIVVSNSQNVTIEVPLEHYELFKSGLLDKDLSKMTSPLVAGRIDAAEIEARPVDGIAFLERITVDERPYFDVDSVSVTKTQRTWHVAKLNSLTKSTSGGYLYLTDGGRAFYRYLGPDPVGLQRLFGDYDGLVRIYCEAHLDESLRVVEVDVFDIERVQGDLLADLPIPPKGESEGDKDE